VCHAVVTIELIKYVHALPNWYKGEILVVYYRMYLDGIRFYRNWTSCHNFRVQIEELEIPQESVEKL